MDIELKDGPGLIPVKTMQILFEQMVRESGGKLDLTKAGDAYINQMVHTAWLGFALGMRVQQRFDKPFNKGEGLWRRGSLGYHWNHYNVTRPSMVKKEDSRITSGRWDQ